MSKKFILKSQNYQYQAKINQEKIIHEKITQEKNKNERPQLTIFEDKTSEHKTNNDEEREKIEKLIENQINNNIIINVEDTNQLNNKIASIDIQLKQLKFIKIDILDLFNKQNDYKDIIKSNYHEITDCINNFILSKRKCC